MGDTWLSKLAGTIKTTFKIGGASAPTIKNNSGVIEIKNSGDTDFAVLRALGVPSSGENMADLVNLLHAKSVVALVQFSFAGASAPSPGTNNGKFGFCHTSGGAYTAGDVVYDNNTSLVAIPSSICKHITVQSAVSGTISLIANGFYSLQNGTWTLKGDGGSTTTGLLKTIEVPFDYGTTPIDSSTSIPDGARVLRTRIVVTTAFDGASTFQITVNGSTPETLMATGDSDPATIGEYQNQELFSIDSDSEGVVRVTVGGSPTVGAASAFVEYVTPLS